MTQDASRSDRPRAVDGHAPDVFKREGQVPMREYPKNAPVDFVIVGAGCGGSDAIQIACILAFLSTVVFFIFFLPRLLSTNQRLRERAIDMVVSVRAGPRPMTPSPQELSISRT